MNRKKTLGIIAIIVLMSFLIPSIQAPNIEVSPVDTDDDAFITGIGAYFGDTPFLPLRDSVQNIIIGTRFRNVAIPQGTKINNATLFVRSIYGYGPASNITVIIAGDDSDDSAPFNDSGSFSRTFTSAFQIWDISEIVGNDWYNVSVTNIVQEIVDRVEWNSGNDLSLMFRTFQGTPRREFASIDGNPAYVARLNITFGEVPTTPQTGATPPFDDPGVWDWIYNDTYRGIDIWNAIPVNRSGFNFDIDWEILNITELTENDSGADIVRQNDTWADIDGLTEGVTGRLFNDTGVGNNHAFLRTKIFVESVTNGEAGNEIAAAVFGVSTTDTYPYLVGGNGIWIMLQLNSDDIRYRYVMRARTGAADWVGGVSNWYTEGHGFDYLEVHVNDQGPGSPYITWRLYTDETYRTLLDDDIETTNILGGDNWRYAMIVTSSRSLGSTSVTFDQYTFLNRISLDLSETFLAYPNGTLVDPDPLPDGVDPEDAIDDLLGGAQPEDPQEDEYPIIGKFQWKLLVLVVGMLMLLGSPIAGVYYGGDTATWIKILFVMFFGIGILWQIKSM